MSSYHAICADKIQWIWAPVTDQFGDTHNLFTGTWHVASGKWHTLWTQKIDFCKQQQLSVAVGTYVEGPQRQKIVRLLASEGDAIKDVYICTYI